MFFRRIWIFAYCFMLSTSVWAQNEDDFGVEDDEAPITEPEEPVVDEVPVTDDSSEVDPIALQEQLNDMVRAYGERFRNVFEGRAALVNATGQGNAAITAARAQMLNATANYIRAHAQYYLFIAQARLFYAQARYYDAVTRRLDEETKFWRQLNKRMRIELRRLQRKEYEGERRAKRVQKYLKTARVLQSNGRVTRGTHRAYLMVLQNIDPTVATDVQFSEVEALEARNFKANKRGEKNELNFDGGSLRELLDFALENDLSFWPGRKAHFAIAQSFGSLAAATGEFIDRIMGDLLAMREATLEDWEKFARLNRSPVPGQFGGGFGNGGFGRGGFGNGGGIRNF